ncbi:hypothetical protein [Aureibacter tunicatorum]|uniref:Uncharacterized protein n=1 Tax=Aureibacter tunicatorum TaxID=866807 RepID=A0AAE4BU73_9BACT|nr:hypothetical protein [Aureibacter tunicatorum]MDR6240745.1 hypothetical protein [Aureibacter tunicatorum]BDD06922.1 hypothetical protein AUTU_44050 [Aureibacter tunicatorum]
MFKKPEMHSSYRLSSKNSVSQRKRSNRTQSIAKSTALSDSQESIQPPVQFFNGEHDSDIIQRKVGFEFETGWKVSKEEIQTGPRGRDYIKRTPLKKRDPIGVGSHDGFKLEADKAENDRSEIEFIIYPPLDETPLGLVKLNKVMSDMVGIGAELLKFSHRRSFLLSEATGLMEDSQFVVYPNDAELGAGPQITSGLDLSKLPYLLTASNASTQAPKELMSSLRHFAKAGAKVINNLGRAQISPEMHGLLTIMVSYLEAGRGQIGLLDRSYSQYDDLTKANLAVEYPKIIADVIMARTDFGGLFNLLPSEEQEALRAEPEKWLDLVIGAAGGYKEYDPFESVIERGIQKDIYSDNPSVEEFPTSRYEWIMDIPKGRDRMSEFPGNLSMGYLGKKTELVGNGIEGGIFEFRGAQANKLPLKRWHSFALESFSYISALNGRSLGEY